jgi:hypothetical protein
MVLQGVFVGLHNHNPYFENFNDSVPLLLMAMNSLRIQSPTEMAAPIKFSFLVSFCSWASLAICLIGFAAQSLGLPSTSALSGVAAGFYFALLAASVLTGYKLKWIYWLCFLIVLVFSASDFNRTTVAFFIISAGFLFLKLSLQKPLRALSGMMIASFVIFISWNSLTEDSKTKRRINDLWQVSSESRTGSIGERMNEWVSIQAKVAEAGTTARWIGLGHGALYNVQYTHTVIKDYGFAHFAWALFYLRYGLSGYLFLTFFALILVWQTCKYWSYKNPVSMTVALLSMVSVLYLATYVNFVILCLGLQFLVLKKNDPLQNEP